jgi:hypothetical protein
MTVRDSVTVHNMTTPASAVRAGRMSSNLKPNLDPAARESYSRARHSFRRPNHGLTSVVTRDIGLEQE